MYLTLNATDSDNRKSKSNLPLESSLLNYDDLTMHLHLVTKTEQATCIKKKTPFLAARRRKNLAQNDSTKFEDHFKLIPNSL